MKWYPLCAPVQFALFLVCCTYTSAESLIAFATALDRRVLELGVDPQIVIVHMCQLFASLRRSLLFIWLAARTGRDALPESQTDRTGELHLLLRLPQGLPDC